MGVYAASDTCMYLCRYMLPYCIAREVAIVFFFSLSFSLSVLQLHHCSVLLFFSGVFFPSPAQLHFTISAHPFSFPQEHMLQWKKKI